MIDGEKQINKELDKVFANTKDIGILPSQFRLWKFRYKKKKLSLEKKIEILSECSDKSVILIIVEKNIVI